MSWKKRHAVAEAEAKKWWKEVLKQDRTMFEQDGKIMHLEHDIDQLQAERTAMAALLWETVAEVNRLRSLHLAEYGMYGQVQNLHEAVNLAAENDSDLDINVVVDALQDILDMADAPEDEYVVVKRSDARWAANTLFASYDRGDQYVASNLYKALGDK